MTDSIPDPVVNRCVRRRIALNMVGSPIEPSLVRHLDSLKSQEEGDTTVIYDVETHERVSRHSPDSAIEFVEVLAEKKRRELETESARGVRGRLEMEERLLEEIPQDSY